MRMHGACEYTETSEYEANKIHIRLASLRTEIKKLRIRRTIMRLHARTAVGRLYQCLQRNAL
jgi:hypothetical protein